MSPSSAVAASAWAARGSARGSAGRTRPAPRFLRRFLVEMRVYGLEVQKHHERGSGVELDEQSFLRVAEGWIKQLGKSSVAQKDLNCLTSEQQRFHHRWLQLCCSHIIVQTQFVGSIFLNIHRNCQHSPGLLPTPKILGMKDAQLPALMGLEQPCSLQKIHVTSCSHEQTVNDTWE